MHSKKEDIVLNQNSFDEGSDYYEIDDGPLTLAQLARIDEVNTCKDVSENEVVNRLF